MIRRAQGLLQFLLLREQGFDLFLQLMHGRIDFARDGADETQLLIREVVGA